MGANRLIKGETGLERFPEVAVKEVELKRELDTYVADLHIHTVLSPCANVEMIPPLIVQTALEKGINLIAITDHNASANVSAVQKAAARASLTVLPGMELQTREEVHLLCLFDTPEQLAAWQAMVDARLPDLENDVEFFGEQFVVNETGEFIRREHRLLSVSVDFSLREAVTEVTRLGGIVIPAHIDRQAYSLVANLGLLPTDVSFEALEISRFTSPAEAYRRFPQIGQIPLIQNGDAHSLDELLGTTIFRLAFPSVAELRLALLNAGNRSFFVQSG
ncbi:MAG: PHP domain-containing protein [Anaerolineae bacterium]|nr:PHP domain-containing protein [Anaerolineae bacterium]